MSDSSYSAPLADADLSEMQGLTLEELTRLHGESVDEPAATLETDEQDDNLTESEVGFALQEHAGQAEFEAPVDRRLRQALVISYGGEEVHLDQKDDLRVISSQAVNLFQETLPESMQRLGQFLHAREQTEHLYDRLSELSNNRGAAAEIIQTAKQIESFDKQLQQEQLEVSQFSKLDAELAQFEQVIASYRKICALAVQLG